MSGSLEPVVAAINELGDRFGHLESRVANLGVAVMQLRVDAMGRLDRQHNMLTAIRDGIAVNMAATGRVRNANAEAQQDVLHLTEQVSLIHRRLVQLEERVDRSGARP